MGGGAVLTTATRASQRGTSEERNVARSQDHGRGLTATVSDVSAIERVVTGYLDHLTVERGLAANSIASYRRDLRRYTEYLASAGVTALREIT